MKIYKTFFSNAAVAMAFMLLWVSGSTRVSAQAAGFVRVLPGAERPMVVKLQCAPFYLPARSIWQRTVDIELDAEGVRAVKIDGVAVYTFNVNGTSILTAVDGERIQVDIAALTWSSDLRGMVSSRGNCTR